MSSSGIASVEELRKHLRDECDCNKRIHGGLCLTVKKSIASFTPELAWSFLQHRNNGDDENTFPDEYRRRAAVKVLGALFQGEKKAQERKESQDATQKISSSLHMQQRLSDILVRQKKGLGA